MPYPAEYSEYSALLHREVESMPGFCKFENWVDSEGYSVSLSYWETLDNLEAWKMFPKHQEAKKKGKWNWYSEYSVEVCQIVKSYSGKSAESPAEKN